MVRKKGIYCLKLFVILLTICLLTETFGGRVPVMAAGSQYGIWCPVCAKWQDHFYGAVEGMRIFRTDYTGSENKYDGGMISVACMDCRNKLIHVECYLHKTVHNFGSEDEYDEWVELHEVVTYEAGVVFPKAIARMDDTIYPDEEDENKYLVYYVAADGNAFGVSNPDAEEESYDRIRASVKALFAALADCLTWNYISDTRYEITDGEFTWADWYNSGLRTDSSGNKTSGFIDYMNEFGIQALSQNSCQIIFYANGGEGSMGAVTASVGSSSTLPANAFSRQGYRFLGWATAANGEVLYGDGAAVQPASDMALYAVWEKIPDPPILHVEGDAQIKLYRNGMQISGAVNAGDRVEIIPTKKQGREYAGTDISTNPSDAAWNSAAGVLSFMMPQQDTSVKVFFRELQGLEVSLNSLFYETYQKAPYWNGESFELDCGEPIIVEKNMLHVEAVLSHTGGGLTERRTVTEFDITEGSQIQKLGKNTVTVKADVLRDGYVLTGQCVLKADSSSLSELMEETDSQTYTELKEFVEELTRKLAEYERMIEELSSRLTLSEEERQKCEQMLAESAAEAERLAQELENSRGELAAMAQELEGMKEKLTLMQELMRELTGNTQIDQSAVEALKERFRELEQEKEELEGKLSELEKKNTELTDRVNGLEKEKAGLTDKVNRLEGEKAGLTDKVNGLEGEKAGLTDKVNGLEEEKAGLTDKVNGLEEEKAGLTDMVNGLEGEKAGLTEKIEGLQSEKGGMAEKYAALFAENEMLAREKNRLLAEKERLIKTNEELAEQLKYTLEEQAILIGEYDLLKKNYTALQRSQEQKEQEYKTKLEAAEQSLTRLAKEKEELAGQVASLQQEKQQINEAWKREVTGMSDSIQMLRAENEGWREKAERSEQAYQEQLKKQETETSTVAGKQQPARLEQSVEPEDSMQSEKVVQPGDSVQSEKGVQLEKFSQSAESVSSAAKDESADMGELAASADLIQTERESLAVPEPALSEEESEKQGFGVISRSRRSVLPGIAVVIVAMLLGGAVLYLALSQKEKTANYTCD